MFVLLQSYGEMASRRSQWQPEERGAVPSQSAGSWETGWGAAQWEEYERPEAVPRQSVSQGGGEFIGWRRRWDKWTEREYYEKKRAKVVPEGRVIRRTGPREEKGTFLTWAKEYVETLGFCSFLSIRWPKYAGDYPLGEEISRRTIAEGLYDILENPMTQLGLPFVYFKLRAAMNGVVFKLSSKGTRNANDRLTILGSESIIRLTYKYFYD